MTTADDDMTTETLERLRFRIVLGWDSTGSEPLTSDHIRDADVWPLLPSTDPSRAIPRPPVSVDSLDSCLGSVLGGVKDRYLYYGLTSVLSQYSLIPEQAKRATFLLVSYGGASTDVHPRFWVLVSFP